jgi:hypothetical protein
MWHPVAGHPIGIVSKCHRRATNNEQVCYDASAHQAIAECRKCSFQLGAAHQAVIGHAASKSRADR